MKKIVVTGATSFLGSNTVNYLLQRGYFVYALVRDKSKAINKLHINNNLNIIEFDFDNPDNVSGYIPSVDCFINYAWDSSMGRDSDAVQQKNIKNSMKMLELCRKIGCKKFVFSGSQAEYGLLDSTMNESDLCKPISAYGKAKWEFGEIGEKYATRQGITFIHLRIFSVYGYGDRPNTLVDYCIRSFLNGKNAQLGQSQKYWNYLYIEDFVRIIEKIIFENIETGIINVASQDTRTIKEFVEDIHNVLMRKGSYCFNESYVNAENSPQLKPNISKMLRLLGEQSFTDFKSGIESTVKEYIDKENPVGV